MVHYFPLWSSLDSNRMHMKGINSLKLYRLGIPMTPCIAFQMDQMIWVRTHYQLKIGPIRPYPNVSLCFTLDYTKICGGS